MERKSDKITNLAKRRGFFTQSCEIYNPPAGFFDFGPLGSLMKHNLEDLWRREILLKEGFHEIEACLVNPEEVFIASGHVATFSDPLTECNKCHKRFRADHCVGDQVKISTDGLSVEQLSDLIEKHEVKCPECKGSLMKASTFNLMFKTSIGPSVNPKTAYIRPETAQGMFMNFKWVMTSIGGNLPLGVAQVGRSFRNEISPRQGMLRLREFNQAELEIFLLPDQLNKHPNFSEVADVQLMLLSKQLQHNNQEPQLMSVGEAVEKGVISNQWMAYQLVKAHKLYQKLGIKFENLRCRQHLDSERSHYSKDCWDLECTTDYGWIELIGCAYRTDYDLNAHIKLAGADFYIVDPEGNKIVPHVVEPAYGIDRMFYCVMEHNLREEEGRTWLALPYEIAPIKTWILPIVKDEKLIGLANKIRSELSSLGMPTWVMTKASVGKRYARADEAGVPACITLDRQTEEDQTVTIRERDTKKQIRVKIEDLPSVMQKMLTGAAFEGLGTPI